ncbi:MAG: hypothetical protein BWY82_00104 [Verrucomicrobia bacterium ADurb.Bin474]|nr:MAG: hypothetical protein BWY82_00104 [Verrucomicrobia bacterium ADurb.Bin474]
MPHEKLLCRLALAFGTLVFNQKSHQYIGIDANYVLLFHCRRNMASTPRSISSWMTNTPRHD